LSAEGLAIFKVLFARDKDWRDLQVMLFAQGENFDAGYTSTGSRAFSSATTSD